MKAIKGIASNIAKDIVSTQKELNSLLQGIVISVKTDGWVFDTENGIYSYPVQVQGLTGEEMISVSLYKDTTTTDNVIEFYDVNITDVDTSVNLLTITATAVPTEAFSIVVMGIMNVDDGLDDVKKTLDDTKSSIGDMNTLDKNIGASDLVGAMNSVFQLGNENKATFVSNLNAMGIEADTSETWQALLEKQASTGAGVTIDYIAEPHDINKEYESGDSVVYGDYLYRCKEVTSGEFDDTKWEQIYLTTPYEDFVNKLNSNLSYNYETGNFQDLYGSKTATISVENGCTYLYASVWSESTFTGCDILEDICSTTNSGATCHVYVVKANSDTITATSHTNDPRVFLKLG